MITIEITVSIPVPYAQDEVVKAMGRTVHREDVLWLVERLTREADTGVTRRMEALGIKLDPKTGLRTP